ncbi:MAG TPA: nuclear transport factor 2 family protein [Polyangiaceae bacterium]|nr:nuclear transport factor 2 family protein [Polyangiaceae bacterium]
MQQVTSGAVGAVAAPPGMASAVPARGAKLEAFVERWRSAQNSGDFEAYEKLYANRFVGIKRVGQQVFRFDRKRWLLDRKGMFAHKPEVTAKELTVVDLGKTAVARFEQTFASKSFKDVGTKQLVLLEEEGELRIGREEMLTSLVTAAAGVVGFPDFSFVVHHGGRAFALLERRDPEQGAAIEFVDFESALSPLKGEQALPSSRRGLAQRELTLHGESGEVCRTHVARVVSLSLAIPHFGQRQQWAGELGEPPTPKPEVARDLVELSGSAGSYLALELAANPACTKAQWARAADRPAPQLFTRRAATATETTSALAAFERLPVHSANQKRFVAEGGVDAKGPWYRFHDARPSVRVFEVTGRTWTSVSAEAGHGCAEYRGEGWALFETKADNLDLASHESHHRSYFAPHIAFDANGDGNPEFLANDLRLLQVRDGRYEIVLTVATPIFECGC